MPSIYELKPRFQALLRPVAHALGRMHVTANAVTIAAVAGSAVAGIAVTFATDRPLFLLVLPIWLFLRMALNTIDGMMARELGMASKPGAILNELGDVLSDIFLYLPLAFVVREALWPIVAFTLGAAVTEFAGVTGQVVSGERQYQGPMGKSDRAFLAGLLALLTFFWPVFLRFWPWVFWVAFALTLVTVWNRCRAALRKAAR